MKSYRDNADTIAACATPSGRGGIGIVRISGPLATMIAKAILGTVPKPRYAAFAAFLDKSAHIIDAGLALFFPAPASFTGEDILELHCHGGIVVQDRVLSRVIELGARLARPGEFSERAFLNGKIDLTQAEAIADLINASSRQAARFAIHSLQGGFSQLIKQIKDAIIRQRLQIEAGIDFPEEDLGLECRHNQTAALDGILANLSKIKENAQQGVLLRDGINVVIAGKPNVGKSSLLNSLTGRETAIVTNIPGTTRDVVRAEIHIDGLPLHILDTAGLQFTGDPVEQEGIRRARREIKDADHVLCLVDAYADKNRDSARIIAELELPIDAKNITIVFNKTDLTEDKPRVADIDNYECIFLSVKTGSGLELLKDRIKASVGFIGGNKSENAFSARRRHLEALDRAEEKIFLARQHLAENFNAELIAEDLRQAQNCVDEITGEFSSDDLLGLIFAEFCIGK